ncbi:MAG TPA: inositol monophosphatase family protein [Acidimicrobiales bacterium]|nr:inositol monophosphatase family protein [Acidimicrobiales bacterium]
MQGASADLAFAHVLADAADAVSTAHFRSEELRRTTKVDGTPVSEVDFDVERAMLDIVRSERPTDAFVGEEVGPFPGSSGGRWIVDGIDGTHNYSDGRPGWATIVAYEVDGEIGVGLVSAPRLGRRWWAVRGSGAWSAPHRPDATFDPGAATPLRCGSADTLAEASVIVIPYEGAMLGWRNEASRRFTPPSTPRSQCFAIDAAMVAAGELDVAILTYGGLWDFAATSLIVREAGGVFRDAWGGERFDTATGVFTTDSLVEQVLAALAELRPDAPDVPRLARTVSTPIGTADEQALDGWRKFGIRQLASMSARVHVEHVPPPILAIVEERAAELERPFLGVTTDGVLRTGLRSPGGSQVSTQPIADAALAFLQALTTDQRERATFSLDAEEWRTWINVHMTHFRHGVMLEDLAQPVRDLALGIVRATLSARGFHQARSIMRLNQLLADVTGDHEAFGEWPYFVSVFGTPGEAQPWGWQIDGHHLCVNTLVLDGRIVTTPTFMGAEPRRVRHGPYAGISLFDPEEALGLDLIRSFDGAQRERAIIHPSIHPDDIPAHLQNLFDGRMLAGAFHDNVVAPYQGVPGADMTDAQRRVLLALAGTYVDWTGAGHAEVRMTEVSAHLDETWFSWYGGTGDESPFYYRVHSPVILIEFDHHPGVAFDNEVPSRYHVHTVVRTPNGGDYGADLLGQHHERFDHRHGTHEVRM